MKDRYENIFYKELFESVVPFWTKYGYDKTYGGIITSLDRKGEVYSSDKGVWMQGRTAYIFASLINEYGMNEEYKEIAKSCIDFMNAKCIDKDKRMYFLVNREGEPLRKRRYYFSELFYVIANVEYYLATQDKNALDSATEYFDFVNNMYLDSSKDPYKITPKFISSTRELKSLALPMILLNTAQIMRKADAGSIEYYNKAIDIYIEDIKSFQLNDTGLFLECIGVDGTIYEDIASCRVINPGHSIELSWFILDEGIYRNNKSLIELAEKMFDVAYQFGIDKEYGGLVYFKDYLNKPVEAYEHDMKLWWVHCESMIASLKLYEYTKNEKYWEIFKTVSSYAFEHFADSEYGEWYGYLRRDGNPTEPACKGHIYKGPYHVPRMLIICNKILAKIHR